MLNLDENNGSLDYINSISIKERNTLLETVKIMIDDYISHNILAYANPTFDETLETYITTILLTQLSPIISDVFIEEFVNDIFDEALSIYNIHITPARSINPSQILYPPKYLEMKKKINYLKQIPQPDQRTDDWYTYRHRYITASSAWKAFGTISMQNQLIYDKCKPLNIEKYKQGGVSTNTPMHWGQKYEDVSIMWYENNYDTHVDEFGCIPHATYSYIAASPDGINTKAGSRYGRMLEVKNIVNREITGIPKFDYWIQMQLQLEVCDLNECDFLETRFIEYENEDEFKKDGTFNKTADNNPKGIIIFFIDNNKPLYEYCPWNCTEQEYAIWEKDILEKHANLCWIQNLYWRLDEVSCVLVQRNKNWFEAANPVLKKLWDTIEKEKYTGYEHRAPKKKERCVSSKPRKCMINVNDLSGIHENTSSENTSSENGASSASNVLMIDTEPLQYQ